MPNHVTYFLNKNCALELPALFGRGNKNKKQEKKKNDRKHDGDNLFCLHFFKNLFSCEYCVLCMFNQFCIYCDISVRLSFIVIALDLAKYRIDIVCYGRPVSCRPL